MNKSYFYQFLHKPLKTQDAFRAITRSVIGICGSVFLFIVIFNGYHIYSYSRLLGYAQTIYIESKTQDKIPRHYWQQLLSHLKVIGCALSQRELISLQALILQTGYFKELTLSYQSPNTLKIDYHLAEPYAYLNQKELYLLETGKFLPLIFKPLNQPLVQITLSQDSSVQSNHPSLLEEKIQIALKLIKKMQGLSFAQLKKIDLSLWQGKTVLSSQVCVFIQNEQEKGLWIRLGQNQIEHERFWNQQTVKALIESSFEQSAKWIDARVPYLLIVSQ